MENLVKTFYGMHQTLALSVFETIGQAILGQQLSASVARVIRQLLVETYGPRLEVEGETHYAFPPPENLRRRLGGGTAGPETKPTKG